ncbi:MAG: tetratricopeptide repeat protein [Synechococcaceae cyanobacterium]|nr:tetratricopeptide repeat protein [Synechococcaceae cyanobacterium]
MLSGDHGERLAQARALRDSERLAEALEAFAQLLRLAPEAAQAWQEFGELLENTGNLGRAVQAYRRCAELAPDDITCRSRLGHLLRNMSLPEEAIHWHGEALRLHPSSLVLRLNHAFVLPVVPTSLAQLEGLRRRCEQELEAICADVDPLDLDILPEHVWTCHPYYLLYQNHNDRPLLERYGRLMGHYYGDGRSVPSTDWNGQRRLRIGFLSAYFYEHSNARAFEGLLRHLDRQRFAPVLIHAASPRHDAVSEQLEGCCEQVLHLAPDLKAGSAALRALDLDLLFFTDIGMHPMVTALACQRLAPLQVTGWGVPCTSGLTHIDAYLSGEAAEPPQAQDHYSETLIRLPGLPCCYLSENIRPEPLPRDWFLLPPDEPLFGCLQPFQKFHPDFDAVLEALAREVPEAWFVLVEDRVTSLSAIYLDRLAETAPTARERIVLLARMALPQFQALAACLDVLLDPLHFSSGISFYETIHAGTPTVTLEGRFLRNRFVAGAYRLMGVENPPIAGSIEEYVALAAGLMRDPDRRERLRREIREKAQSRLYDRLDYVRGFEDFVIDAIRAPESLRSPRESPP